MRNDPVYKRVYFHAVRRAMQENEKLMQKFMDSTAVNYDELMLERLDTFLIKIPDNDLFDLIMGHKSPSDFKLEYDEDILVDIVKGTTIRLK